MENNTAGYEAAAELFEMGNYDAAVAGFIDIFQSGNIQEQILEDLYNCFILPNEAEFRANYEDNQLGQTVTVPYEQLAIDFIPVTEEKFYLYDKIKKEFLGCMDLMQIYKAADVVTFDSLLIAEQWDLREILTITNSKRWNQIYIVLEACENYVMSFFKLPGIKNYLQNVRLFSTLAELEQYLRESTTAYLPKCFYAEDDSIYRDKMKSIHEARIQNLSKKSSQVFLSICIPSYNRGSIAVQTVRNLLKLEYDYEIQIVISNNGSTQDTEGYEEIKQIQDSRIKYFEFEEGQGYASNIRTVLELADGAYVIAASDEDMMELEQFPQFLDYVMAHLDAGIIVTSGIGVNFTEEEESGKPIGAESVIAAINRNYLTGITYNMTYVRKNRVFQRFDSMRGNLFLEYYAHCVLAAMTAEYSEVRYSSIKLWNAEIIEEYRKNQTSEAVKQMEQEETGILEYGTIESRLAQQNSAVEFIMQEIHMDMRGQLCLIADRMMKTYYLLENTYESHYDILSQKYRWIDICMILYKNNLSLLDTSMKWFKQNVGDSIVPVIDSVFLGFYKDNPAKDKILHKDDIQEKMICLMIDYCYNEGQSLAQMDITEFTKEIQTLLEK